MGEVWEASCLGDDSETDGEPDGETDHKKDGERGEHEVFEKWNMKRKERRERKAGLAACRASSPKLILLNRIRVSGEEKEEEDGGKFKKFKRFKKDKGVVPGEFPYHYRGDRNYGREDYYGRTLLAIIVKPNSKP